jgi:hypothetical protein
MTIYAAPKTGGTRIEEWQNTIDSAINAKYAGHSDDIIENKANEPKTQTTTP